MARGTQVGVATLALGLLFTVAVPAFATGSATVNAQVEVNPYSIVLDEGANLDYGTLNPGDVAMPGLERWIMVRNNGGADVQLSVIGTDATNGTGGVWELDPMSVGADQFRWEMVGPLINFVGVDDVSTTPLSIMPLFPGEAKIIDSILHMPTSTTAYGTYSWSATIYATAP